MDDQGNTATFVETEQIILLGNHVASFVVTRGSVPVFWEQPGFQVSAAAVEGAIWGVFLQFLHVLP